MKGDADTMTGSGTDNLAVIVKKPRTEAAIKSLRSEEIYDDDRQIAPYNGDHVAIPVTDVPARTATTAVREVDLPRRTRGLTAILAGRGVAESVIDAAPSSWAVIGSVVLVDFGDVSTPETLDAAEREIVGEALLELHGDADTVLARGGIEGTRRDPSVTVVAGVGETETVHTEHGIEYAVDFSRVMFSPGNKAERARMGEVVGPDERVFDMFAGLGYFTLPMASAGASVTAAEIDPDAYRLLVENARLNGVTDSIRAVLGDCRTVETTVDRVVAGYYDAYEYLDPAIEALVPGGTIHLHEATPEPLFPERPIKRLTAAVETANRSIDVSETRVIKSHSAGVVHGVVDARIE